MHPLVLHEAETRFYCFIDERRGRNVPVLQRVLRVFDLRREEVRFVAQFRDSDDFSWSMPRRAIHDRDFEELMEPCDQGDMVSVQLAELYCEQYEKWLTERAVAPVRRSLLDFCRLTIDDDAIDRQISAYREVTRVIAESHRGAGRHLYSRPAGSRREPATFDVGTINWREMLAEPVRPNAFAIDEYDKQRAKAERTAIELLRSWLSPRQLVQYDQHKWFEVVGCDTGTVYRIITGCQMNIMVLDKSGEQIATLCFTPTGGLPDGDCMLAQKLHLEQNEREVLKVANRASGSIRGYVGIDPYFVAHVEALRAHVMALTDAQCTQVSLTQQHLAAAARAARTPEPPGSASRPAPAP